MKHNKMKIISLIVGLLSFFIFIFIIWNWGYIKRQIILKDKRTFSIFGDGKTVVLYNELLLMSPLVNFVLISAV